MIEQLHSGAKCPDDVYDADGNRLSTGDVDRRNQRRQLIGHGLTPREADRLIDEQEDARWRDDAMRPQPGDDLETLRSLARERWSAGSDMVFRRMRCVVCGRALRYAGPSADRPTEPRCPGKHRPGFGE